MNKVILFVYVIWINGKWRRQKSMLLIDDSTTHQHKKLQYCSDKHYHKDEKRRKYAIRRQTPFVRITNVANTLDIHKLHPSSAFLSTCSYKMGERKFVMMCHNNKETEWTSPGVFWILHRLVAKQTLLSTYEISHLWAALRPSRSQPPATRRLRRDGFFRYPRPHNPCREI